MDNRYDWETFRAIKEDWRYIKDITYCLTHGHNYEPDYNGYCCQKCYWVVATTLELDSWQAYYDARPSKWTWRG